MENSKIQKLTDSAIKDCQNLKTWVVKNESRNNELIDLVSEVEGLIIQLKKQSLN